jgi:cysteine dioxygenase
MLESPVLKQWLAELDQLSKKQFPVSRVTEFLQNSTLGVSDLQPYLYTMPGRYVRNLVYHCPEFEVLVLCWGPGQESPIHGHEDEKCWMRVLLGTLRFVNYKETTSDSGMLDQVSDLRGDVGFVDGPAVIHKVQNPSNQPAISLHLYARPYVQCDVYQPELQVKKKISLAYDSMYGIAQHEGLTRVTYRPCTF